MKEDDVDSEAGNVARDDDSDNEDSDDEAEEAALADDDDTSSESDRTANASLQGIFAAHSPIKTTYTPRHKICSPIQAHQMFSHSFFGISVRQVLLSQQHLRNQSLTTELGRSAWPSAETYLQERMIKGFMNEVSYEYEHLLKAQ